MTEKQIKQIIFAAQNFGADHAATMAKLFKAANNLDSLAEQVAANSKAFQAKCEEDTKKIKAH